MAWRGLGLEASLPQDCGPWLARSSRGRAVPRAPSKLPAALPPLPAALKIQFVDFPIFVTSSVRAYLPDK